MLRDLLHPQNSIKLMAGLSGLLFDKIAGLDLPAELGMASVPSDDLTQINGIGPTFARRLEEAGVNTFAKVATLTAEDLREISRAATWQANPEEWIVQAQAMA